MHRTTASLLAVLSLAACERKQPSDAVTVSDSAGVHIVANREPAWTAATAWRLGAQPTLQIGGGVADTSTLVGPVAGAFRLRDGRVVVADRGAHAIRWFTSDGKPLLRQGREGEGPGEFRWMSRVLEVDDSIAVFDPQLHRLSIFDSNGNLGRTITMAAGGGTVIPPEPIGRLSTGRWIATSSSVHTLGEPSGPSRDSAWTWITGSDGSADTLIAALPGSDVLIASGEHFMGVLPAPFGRTTTVRVHDGAIWVGTGDSYRIDALDLQGRLITSVRLDQRLTLLDPARGAAVVDSVRKGFSARNIAAMIAQTYDEALDKLKLPEFEPPYSTFRIADDSTLWVEKFVTEGHTGATKWDVFLPDGRLQGTITLPPGFTPTQIGHQEILGVWKDPDGIDHVVAYPLLRGEGS